jgi:hypothetical protein
LLTRYGKSSNGSSNRSSNRLRRQGFLIRAIADRLGLSRSSVHRRLAAAANDLADDDGGGRFEDPYQPIPRTRSAVSRRWSSPDRHDDPRTGQAERYLDAKGVPCTVLDIWRWCTYAEAEREDYAGADAVRDDIERQIAAAGWVQVSTGDGYWRWEQG